MARQSGLGRGLDALLPQENRVQPGQRVAEPVVEQRDGLQEVQIDSIVANAYQPRKVFGSAELDSLALSIEALGVLQPLLVRRIEGGRYELIAGERRLRASKLAGLVSVPVVVREADNQGALEQAIVENLHRSDLNALEEAAAYRQLIDDFGLTHESVATRVGKSRTAITNTLRLLQLPATIQTMLMEGKLSAGHARALLGTDDAAFQDSLARRIATDELSVRATEEAVKLRLNPREASLKRPSSDSAAPSKLPELRDAGLLEVEQRLGDFLDTRVGVNFESGKKGKLILEFADLADLERIFRIVVGD